MSTETDGEAEAEDEDVYQFTKNFAVPANEICQVLIANTLDIDFRINQYNNTSQAFFKVSGNDNLRYFRQIDGNYMGDQPENGSKMSHFNPAV